MQNELGELDANETGLDARHEHAASALAQAEQRVEELREQERAAAGQVASLTARIEALSLNLQGGDASGWLVERREGSRLAEMVTVEPGFEAAVAAAMGPAADAIAVDSRQSAQNAVAALVDADVGRAAVVFPGAAPPDVPRAALPGSARWLVDVSALRVRLAPAYWLRCSPGSPSSTTFLPGWTFWLLLDVTRAVTRSGDLIGTGWIVGGSDRAPSRIELRAAIDSATGELESAQRRAEELAAALSGALDEQRDRREGADEALTALHESDRALSAVYEQLGRLGQVMRQAQTQAERLSNQRAGVEEGREQTRDEAGRTRRAAARWWRRSTRRTRTRIRRCRGRAPVTVRRPRQALAQVRAVEVEARLALRTAEERAESVRGKADSLRRAAAAERQARARAQRALQVRRQAAALAAAVAESGRAVAAELDAVVAEAAAHRDELLAQRSAVAGDLDGCRQRVGELSAQLGALTDTVHRDEVARAQAALRIEQLEAVDHRAARHRPRRPGRRVRSRRFAAAVGAGDRRVRAGA